MSVVEILGYSLITYVTGIASLILLLFILWPKLFEKYKYPPGPLPLPIIGNQYFMFQNDKSRYKCEKWCKKYGNVVSSVSFGRWTVEFFGFDAIHEAFVTNAEHFSDRTYSYSTITKCLKPDELVAAILHLYVAGYDTSASALTWAVLYLVNYPDCQQRIYNEISNSAGGRSVRSADRGAMPYTEAFIHEVLRAGGVTGWSLIHLCTADTVIQGHNIPKGTRVVANLYSTYHDESVYPDSYTFSPERFLNEDGAFIKPSGKQMLPFSVGKRACLGESLARTELFMFLVSFVQRFEAVRLSADKVSEEGIDVFLKMPKLFEFDLKPRQ